MKFFISGRPKVGKSTLIRKLIENLKGKWAAGFITPEIIENGKRVGFYAINISTGEKIVFAHTSINGVRFGKYRVDVKSFEKLLEKIEKEVEKADVIIIDEIGKMEFLSKRFENFLDKIFSSDKPVIATLHRALIKKFEKYGDVIWLTEKNRNKIFEEILKKLT